MLGVASQASFKYLRRHPLQAILSIIGVMLGVAVVLSVDIANQSSLRAFEMSMEAVIGKSTHEIIAGEQNIPDSIYHSLRVKSGIKGIAPVIERFVIFKGNNSMTFRLMGVDPFAEKDVRPYFGKLGRLSSTTFNDLLTLRNAVMISNETAKELSINIGDSILIEAEGINTFVHVIGTIELDNSVAGNALKDVMVCDISSAQEILNMTGLLSRIDVSDGNSTRLESIRKALPANYRVQSSESHKLANIEMIRAFDVNLSAMSLLALIVGMFLIYNTMTFSVVQRRRQIGLLRAIGVTRREIFTIFLSEALLLGLLGTIFGLLVGTFLGKFMVSLVTQSINDLYFVLSVKNIEVLPASIFKSAGLGIVATLLAAIRPALEATNAPPRIVMSRSFTETNLLKRIPVLSYSGLTLLVLSLVIFLIDDRSIIGAYIGVIPLILGSTLLTPISIVFFVRLIKPLIGKLFGSIGRMATQSIITQLSRTSIAVAALTISVAAALGVGTMVHNFRQTVVHWLENRLAANIYVSVPTKISRFNDATFNKQIVPLIEALPEVNYVNMYREIMLFDGNKTQHVLATRLHSLRNDILVDQSGSREVIWEEFNHSNSVFVTEPYAFKHNVRCGDSIILITEFGRAKFKVSAIFYDYSSDIGMVLMSYNNFQRYWRDDRLSGLAVFTHDKINNDSLMQVIRQFAEPNQRLIVRSNKNLLSTSIDVFDRSFIITHVLQLLAIGVAFIGILSSLMSIQLERTRELGIMRANGLTPQQLFKLIILQTGLMGIVSGLIALPLGNVLSWILSNIINKRSFGWSLQFEIVPDIMLQAVLISFLAALMAGLYPAWRMSRTSPAIALREE